MWLLSQSQKLKLYEKIRKGKNLKRFNFGAFGLFIILFLSITNFIFAQEITKAECLECHSDKDLTTMVNDTVEVSLFIDDEKYSNSIHGEFECVECHANIEEIPHDEELPHPDCNMCHEDVAEEYAASIHGIGQKEGNPGESAYCWDCHTAHYIYPADDSLSSLSMKNQPALCARCHSNPEIIKKFRIPLSSPSEVYKNSVHYKVGMREKEIHAAKCTDCHGAHDTQPSKVSTSKTNKYHIAQTCSKCHPKIYQEYIESVHGEALVAGVSESPSCTDCHSEHNIQYHTDPNSTVYSTVISKTLCPQCHEAERIVAKYSLNNNVVASYQDSYHGLASRGGSVVSANCASCHGVHNIKPSSDPTSAINKDNLAETCGKCHPGVSSQVSKGLVHADATSKANKILYYVTAFYLMLITGTIGGMLFHNGLDFRKKFAARLKGNHESNFEELNGKQFIRLTVNERIQHFLLMFSFIMLVYTGFAMKFPEAWWAAPLIRWEGAFAIRGLLHRLAAVVMIGLSVYHVFYLITNPRGRGQFVALLPKLKDLKDVVQMFRYYFGISQERPKFERFNYIEKAEYWALIWGTIVMSLTGFILWFENIALRFFPKWITDVSLLIHYYEAVLASLAILVWHFYFQFFDPHVYPMNTTCITGKMSEEDFKEEHAADYERLTKNN